MYELHGLNYYTVELKRVMAPDSGELLAISE